MKLSRFPRISLGHLPTPLEPLENLTKFLDGPNIWIKRDDCTGLATGGNKTRKLEFLMAEALQLGADTVITQGAVQSNHVRQTAAAACKLGMACEVILERRVPHPDEDYENSGNVLLDRLFGAEIRHVPSGSDMNAEMETVAGEVRATGHKPYIIPGGGSNPVGALGYVYCALEILQQAKDKELRIDHVVHATGSTGTQAGLVTGFEGAKSGVAVLGISVRLPREQQEEAVYSLVKRTAEFIGIEGGVKQAAVIADGNYFGPGYGMPTPGMIEAVELTARHEGILLDPVYTGKGMAGLIDLIRTGHFKKGESVIFVHTGGAASLFGYRALFTGQTES